MTEECLDLVEWHTERFLQISKKIHEMTDDFDELNNELYEKILNSEKLTVKDIIRLGGFVDVSKLSYDDEVKVNESSKLKIPKFDEFVQSHLEKVEKIKREL